MDEKLQIITQNGAAFEGVPEVYLPTGKVTYMVEIDKRTVRFGGNHEIGEALIIPYDPPADIDLRLLEDIAQAIERAVF